MTESERNSRQSQKKLILAIVILAGAAFVFLLALLINATSPSAAATVDGDSYADEVAAALNGADAAIGKKLISETDCAACHLTGQGRAAPLFVGLASAAEKRRPPLSAEQYLYEAIVLPAAHLVDGYANAMPNDYHQRLSSQDIGHMIVYLLTLTDGGDKP
jgi:cytochrome c